MTTSITVRVNGSYVREVTIDGGEPINVGPGNSIERTFHHGDCYNKTVTIGPERSATADEIAAAYPAPTAQSGTPETDADPANLNAATEAPTG